MNDAQIIRELKKRSETAINHAMNKYAKLIWHIVAIILINAGSAEDIEECVADVFIYFWQNHENYKEQRGGLKTWLSVIAKSKAIDKYRQLAKKNVITLNEKIMIEGIAVIDDVMTNETKRELAAAINALSESDREIILRRYYYQQKPKEIGFILDIPVKHVENRLYRSKQKLREMLV